MDHIDKNYLWPCNGYHTVLITHCLYLIEAVPVSDISQIQLVGFLLICLVTLLGMDIIRITVYCTCAIIARSLVQYRQTDRQGSPKLLSFTCCWKHAWLHQQMEHECLYSNIHYFLGTHSACSTHAQSAC